MASSYKYNRPWFAWVLIALGLTGMLWLRFREHRPQDATAEEVPARPSLPSDRLPRFRDDSVVVKTEPLPVASVKTIVRNRTRDSRPETGHFYERIGTDDANIKLNVIDPVEPTDRLDSLPGGQKVTVGEPLIIVR